MKNCHQFKITKNIKQEEYNPLLDKYLSSYFENKQVLKNLKRGRLINRQGELIDLNLQKQYVKFHSEHPIEKTPAKEIFEKMRKKKQKTDQSLPAREQFNNMSQHLNNTYLKLPEVLFKKKQ